MSDIQSISQGNYILQGTVAITGATGTYPAIIKAVVGINRINNA